MARGSEIAYSYTFDEKKVAKDFFELPSEPDKALKRSPRSGVISNWEQKYFPILRLVARYMVQELNVEPVEAETLLFKYVTYVGYLFKKNKELTRIENGGESDFVFVPEFDSQAEGVTTLEFLRSKVKDCDSIYAKYFNLGKHYSLDKTLTKDFEHNQGLNDKAKSKFSNGVPFFFDGTDIFEFAKNGTDNSRYDLMVAEAVHAPRVDGKPLWKTFTFNVLNPKENMESFKANKTKAGRSVSLTLFAFIFDEVLTNWKEYSRNNAKKIKFNREIELEDIGYYKDVLYTSHGAFSDIACLDSGCFVTWSLVKPFDFSFEKDGKIDTYTFGPSGIVRH